MFVAGTFYWFQYRPSQIRSSCAVRIKSALDRIDKEERNVEDWYKLRDSLYEQCLNENGLK